MILLQPKPRLEKVRYARGVCKNPPKFMHCNKRRSHQRTRKSQATPLMNGTLADSCPGYCTVVEGFDANFPWLCVKSFYYGTVLSLYYLQHYGSTTSTCAVLAF
eukprot:COSAG02_NODE_1681_length_11351_cov_20.077320_3_plen_104_part_00